MGEFIDILAGIITQNAQKVNEYCATLCTGTLGLDYARQMCHRDSVTF